MAGQNRSASRKQSGKIAFCGMMVALSVALMLTGGLIPIATYCAPMISGVLLLPILLEYGKKTAWMGYLATALIVLILGIDKEAAFFYIFLGYYPIIKWSIDKLHQKPMRVILKLLLCMRSWALCFIWMLLLKSLLKWACGCWLHLSFCWTFVCLCMIGFLFR